MAIKVANKLRAEEKAGMYSKYNDDPKKFADFITMKIQNYSHDKHMYVEYVDGKDDQSNWVEEWLEQAPTQNYGMRKVEVLKGNIGYLVISLFYPLDIAEPSIQAAMNFLKHTSGMILDLRRNGGGDETSTRAILSTFLPEGHKAPLLIESRVSSVAMPVPHDIKWQHYPDKNKLVILINERTFSAPESLAFSLQEVGRALIIGSDSAGGAHMTDNLLNVSGGYEIGIPNKRPVSKSTGKNWEGIGVIPDIKSIDSNAIEIALEQF